MQLNDFTLDNISDWPASGKAIVIGASCLFILIISYLLIIQPQLTNFSQICAQEKILRADLQNKQQQAQRLDFYQKQAAQLKKVLLDKTQGLIDNRPSNLVLEDIVKTGKNCGLEVKSFKPVIENNKKLRDESSLQIAVAGNYQQLTQFVKQLAALPRLMVLQNFKITPDNLDTGPEKLHMELLAKIYRCQEIAAKALAKPALTIATKLPENFRSPFQLATNDAYKLVTPLATFALSQLVFVGTLTLAKHIQALILAPDATVYKVNIGSVLGNHGGRVVAVANNHLTVQDANAKSHTLWLRTSMPVKISSAHS